MIPLFLIFQGLRKTRLPVPRWVSNAFYLLKRNQLNNSVWKFKDFLICTQILRELNIRDSRNSKTAVLIIFESLDFDEFLLFLRAKISPKSKFRVSKMVKMTKLISHKIRVVGKWLNFHTVQLVLAVLPFLKKAKKIFFF